MTTRLEKELAAAYIALGIVMMREDADTSENAVSKTLPELVAVLYSPKGREGMPLAEAKGNIDIIRDEIKRTHVLKVGDKVIFKVNNKDKCDRWGTWASKIVEWEGKEMTVACVHPLTVTVLENNWNFPKEYITHI